MSSLLGHALAGYTASKCDRKPKIFLWTIWLIFAAVAPDVDYLLLWIFHLRLSERYTHSLGFCLAFSLLTLAALKIFRAGNLKARFVQVLSASLSHLVLDLLVGVYGNPWLWPITEKTFALPWGILPSAGRLSLTNGYMYRNLLIEMGVLIPVSFAVRALSAKERRLRALPWIAAAIPCMIWAFTLRR